MPLLHKLWSDSPHPSPRWPDDPEPVILIMQDELTLLLDQRNSMMFLLQTAVCLHPFTCVDGYMKKKPTSAPESKKLAALHLNEFFFVAQPQVIRLSVHPEPRVSSSVRELTLTGRTAAPETSSSQGSGYF